MHGGGLVFGSEDEFSQPALLFRDRGFITVNVSYRLVDTTGILQNPPVHMANDVKFTDILDDMDAAIAKYKSMSATWNTNTTKLYMAGHSAGAILSMVYTNSDRNINKQIRACGNWAGVTDLTIPHDSLLDDVSTQYKELMYRITGAEMGTANQLAYMYISAYWQANSTGGMPTISVYPIEGLEEDIVTTNPADAYNLINTKNFHTLLSSKNKNNKLIVFENSDHGFTKPANAWQTVVKETADFFKAN